MIFESIFVLDFNVLTIILNWLNQIPEWLVILFGPIILIFLSGLMVGVNSIYYIILSIFRLTYFFKEKSTEDDHI